jgi:hypothetical protein
VVVRVFCICGALLLVFVGVAFGEGAYQRTKDGKTIVWNNDPKTGDVATWFGDRDGQGYATKVGTLTWYTANGAVYARYFGNMVRGKFDGPVNVHSKGKTDHAIFVDGQRTTRWVAGRGASWRVAQQPTKPAKSEHIAEAPAEGPPIVRETEKPLATASSSRGDQPATPSSESFREQTAQQPALSESRTGPIEDTSVKEFSEQRAPPPAKPAATAEPASAGASAVAEPEAPAEGPRVVQAESALATASSSSGDQPATQSFDSFREQATQSPMEDTPSLVIQPSKESVPTPPTSKKSEAEVEDSLQSLVRPPASLLAIPEIAGSPEASPRLTKEEVINLANAKARTLGYNRTDYHRAEPQYNAAYKIWSVSYEQSAADGIEEADKHFSVIVDDKTKGTVFLLRR